MCNSNGKNGNGHLTDKQEMFVNAYLECFNATEAARRAGYQGHDGTLANIGWENVRKPQIAERIKRRLSESAMGADEVLARLASIARADYSAYFDDLGSVNVKRMVEDGKAHLISGVRDTRYGRVIELYDSQRALETLAKHHGLLVDRHELTGKDGAPLFDPSEWERQARERMGHVEQMPEASECGDTDT